MRCIVYQQRRNGYSYKKNGDAIGERLAITALGCMYKSDIGILKVKPFSAGMPEPRQHFRTFYART
jgi:hypothetical protein